MPYRHSESSTNMMESKEVESTPSASASTKQNVLAKHNLSDALSEDNEDNGSASPKTIPYLDIPLTSSISATPRLSSASNVSPPPTPQHQKKAGNTDSIIYNVNLPSEESVELIDSAAAPNALEKFDSIKARLKEAHICIFLDYDGTLTPIVNDPLKAIISEDMRTLVSDLGKKYTNSLSIVTGRKINTIQGFMKLNHIYYAGSHGFDIRKPNGDILLQAAQEFVPDLTTFYKNISEKLSNIAGSLVEDNEFSISVHYRNVDDKEKQRVEELVDAELAPFGDKLKKTFGKMVYEIRPRFDWHKGHAVAWLLQNQFSKQDDSSSKSSQTKPFIPIYLGDDITDEDAFRVMRQYDNSVSVFVKPASAPDRPTAAKYTLSSVDQVQELLQKLLSL